MKEIKAYVRDNMVERVVDALERLPDISAVAVVPVQSYGHSAQDGSMQRVSTTKLEVDIPDSEVQAVIDCIVQTARTGGGHPGDGKILVGELHQAIRIQDGLYGEEALRR